MLRILNLMSEINIAMTITSYMESCKIILSSLQKTKLDIDFLTKWMTYEILPKCHRLKLYRKSLQSN